MQTEIIAKNGKLYEYACRVPSTKKNGEPIMLALWTSTCEKCGAVYDVSVMADIEVTPELKPFAIVHCPAHRLTARESIMRAKEARRLVSDPQVKEIRKLLAEGHKVATLAMIYPLAERTIWAIKYRERR